MFNLPRQYEPQQHKRDRQEGRDGEVRGAHELDVVVDTQRIMTQRVEALHGTRNQRREHGDDRSVVDLESQRDGSRPRPARVRGAQDALGENQVDDEEEEDAGCDEDLRSDGDGDIPWVLAPDET